MLDTARTLAWRLRRHALDDRSDTGVLDIARRVVAVRAWPTELTQLAIGMRQEHPDPSSLDEALTRGELIRSYAFGGGSYVFTPEVAASLLSVRTTTRVWQTRRYHQQGGFALDDWEPLREAVCELLATGPRTRGEIGAHLARLPTLQHLEVGAGGAGADSLYKPLHWWGDICFGPTRATGQTTFRLLRDDPRWPGLPEVDDAGRHAVQLYLAAYGPATTQNLAHWLTEGLSVPRRRVLDWVADLGDVVSELKIADVDAYVLSADLEELSGSEPTDVVRFLPAFDPWVMGPGTADPRVVASSRRALVSRGSNVVVRGGVVSGTWRVHGHMVIVAWFDEAGPAPESALADEVRRVGRIRAQELELAVTRI